MKRSSAEAKRRQFARLSQLKDPSVAQFSRVARLSNDRAIKPRLGYSLRNPSWLPWHWLQPYGRKGNFAQVVAESADVPCHLCKKPLGIRDRDSHEPYEHARCHAFESESHLG